MIPLIPPVNASAIVATCRIPSPRASDASAKYAPRRGKQIAPKGSPISMEAIPPRAIPHQGEICRCRNSRRAESAPPPKNADAPNEDGHGDPET